MFGEIDGAHAAFTQQIEDDVRTENESLVATLKKLLRLEASKDAFVDEGAGRLARFRWQRRNIRHRGGDPRRRRHAAFVNELEQLRRRSRATGMAAHFPKMARTSSSGEKAIRREDLNR